MFELGSCGCYYQDNLLIGYFKIIDWSNKKYDQFIKYLKQINGFGYHVNLDQIKIKKIANQGWNEEWKSKYQPVEIAKKVVIKPSWVKLESEPDREIIEIDPQMAFGTGAHATTQLIIQLLLRLNIYPHAVLDGGTGTGILSIVAGRLFKTKI